MSVRILTIVGARPQFIKSSALSRAFQNISSIEEVLLHTGQHFDANMSDIFFEELSIPKPKYRLNLSGEHHGQMTGRMLEAIEAILIEEKPSAVIVYGDTNSTLAGALAASKLHIPIAHIEAGLRSYNKHMPEEINRLLTDHVSDILLCPTKTSVENLKKEGICKEVHHVGDIMWDAALYAMERIKTQTTLNENLSFLPKNFAFMTIHRAESTKNYEILEKIIDFSEKFSKDNNIKVVFSIHPRTKKLLKEHGNQLSTNFIAVDPLSYFETQYCLSKADFVLTDSGGLQKEAYFHRVPCITLRNETEWVETVENGWNCFWQSPIYAPRKDILEYGDGKAVEKIVKILREKLL